MIKEYNFDEFEPASKEDWLLKLNQDFDDKASKRLMRWDSERNLSLMTYYDQNQINKSKNAIGQFYGPPQRWKYLQEIGGSEPNVNKNVLEVLMNGADGIVLSDLHVGELQKNMSNVKPEFCTIGLKTEGEESFSKFYSWYVAQLKSTPEEEVLLFSTISELNLASCNVEKMYYKKISIEVEAEHPIRFINLNNDLIHKNGAGAQTELVYMISKCVYLINEGLNEGMSIERISKSLFVSTAVGSNYFLEIAKIIAIKKLINQIFELYGLKNSLVYVHACTSELTKSGLDQNTNLLRSTSEAMSVILGGADFLSIQSHVDYSFSHRISRNISNLLREESHLEKVYNPAAGSYYIESLTEQLMSQAWCQFKSLEEKGGYLAALESAYFINECINDKEYTTSKIHNGKRNLVGVNNFGNLDEIIKPERLNARSFGYSLEYEKIRAAVENHVLEHGENARPRVFWLRLGDNMKMITVRQNFISNFFSWAGFQISELQPSSDLTSFSVIVLCAGDEDYMKLTSEDLNMINEGVLTSKMKVLAAGNSDAALASKTIGDWINAKSNKLDKVLDILTELGVHITTESND